MERLAHGGDWAGYEMEYGARPLDFSANTSPLGVPDGVRQAVIAAIATADRYPDPLCRALQTAIGKKEQLPVSYCLCGNGAADLIFRLVLAIQPKRAWVPAPCFREYEAALRMVGCDIQRYALRADYDFRLDRGCLEEIGPGVDLVFLCEPGNPAGTTTARSLILEILNRCRDIGAWVVLDECFNGFLDDPEAHEFKAQLSEFPNLVILKAFTKLYGMAGVRLGYGLCGDGTLLERMRQAGQPWAVSSLAQAAGIAALQDDDYVQRVRCLIHAERPWLAQQLAAIGMTVVPGEANYLLFQSPRALLEPLRIRGILLRSCTNYEGLDASWYRTAVRTHGENVRLIEAMKEVLG